MLQDSTSISIRLTEIKSKLQDERISEKERQQLINTAEILIKAENEFLIQERESFTEQAISYYTDMIVKMLEEGYSEAKIWDFCQVELELINSEIAETNSTLEETESFDFDSIGYGEAKNLTVRMIKTQLKHLKQLKRAFRQFQNFYCKSYRPTTINEQANNVPKDDWHLSKETVYEWFGEMKDEGKKVVEAFDDVKEKILENGYDPNDYIKTDDPLNFNKAYNKWRTNRLKDTS